MADEKTTNLLDKIVMQPLKNIFGMTKDGLKAALAPVRILILKSQLQTEIHQMDAKIMGKQMEIQDVFADLNDENKKVDWQKILDMRDDIRLLIDRRDSAQEVFNELFPTDDAPPTAPAA